MNMTLSRPDLELDCPHCGAGLSVTPPPDISETEDIAECPACGQRFGYEIYPVWHARAIRQPGPNLPFRGAE